MYIRKNYSILKKALMNEEMDADVISSALNTITEILQDWLETGDFSEEFEVLMDTIRLDYLFNGELFRGVTLLNECRDNIVENLNFNLIQSFSKDENIAISFAKNCKVTHDGWINKDYEENEVIPVMLTLKGVNMGIDLHKFVLDILYLSKSYILDTEVFEDIKEILDYSLKEKEVLIYPSNFNNNNLTISVLN